MIRPLLAVLALLACCACSEQAPPPVTVEPTLTLAPVPTSTDCPKVVLQPFPWPSEVPRNLPQPPAATHTETLRRKDGLTIVRFRTQTSLQESVVFLIREVQKAGFTLGRGDAEPSEADAPFGRGDLRGIYKLIHVEQCVTDWLVAVTRTRPGFGNPVLPTASRGPSSSPLPFG